MAPELLWCSVWLQRREKSLLWLFHEGLGGLVGNTQLKFLISVLEYNEESAWNVALPVNVTVQHFSHCCSCPVCLLALSLKASSSATPYRAPVWKVLGFLHKCKVEASSIDCFVRQLQEMTASINKKACLIDISINVKPSHISSISSGTVPVHALHISVYLFQVISGDCSGGIQGREI